MCTVGEVSWDHRVEGMKGLSWLSPEVSRAILLQGSGTHWAMGTLLNAMLSPSSPSPDSQEAIPCPALASDPSAGLYLSRHSLESAAGLEEATADHISDPGPHWIGLFGVIFWVGVRVGSASAQGWRTE